MNCAIRHVISSFAPGKGWQWEAICNTSKQHCTVAVQLLISWFDHNLDRDCMEREKQIIYQEDAAHCASCITSTFMIAACALYCDCMIINNYYHQWLVL